MKIERSDRVDQDTKEITNLDDNTIFDCEALNNVVTRNRGFSTKERGPWLKTDEDKVVSLSSGYLTEIYDLESPADLESFKVDKIYPDAVLILNKGVVLLENDQQ